MRTDAETATLAADVVVIGGTARPSSELSVLLIARGWEPYAGHLALPGGHLDPGEAPVAAAHRELAEETELELEPSTLEYLGVYADPDRDPRGRYVSFAYTAAVPDLPTVAAGDDAAAAMWVRVDRIRGLLIAFDHRQIIAAALQRRYGSGYAL